MSTKPSTFAKWCKVAFVICVIGIMVNGSKRRKLNQQMEPFIRDYETMNSGPYLALSFLEGFANGYAGNETAVVNQAQREFMRENHIRRNLGDLYSKWKSANRDFRLSTWGAGISGVLWLIAMASAQAPASAKQ